jgi:hypothetical protein
MPRISLAIKNNNNFLFCKSSESDKLSFLTFNSKKNFIESIYEKLEYLGLKTKTKPKFIFKHNSTKLFIININNVNIDTTIDNDNKKYIWRKKDIKENYTKIVDCFFRFKTRKTHKINSDKHNNRVDNIPRVVSSVIDFLDLDNDDEYLTPNIKSVINFLEL